MVYIVILNYNGWADTIECLESVFKLKYISYKVVICDNASQDGSAEKIEEWAMGRLEAGYSNATGLKRLVIPPILKPIHFSKLNRESLGDEKICHKSTQCTLIQTGSNLGFAGGNNVGFRYAMLQKDCEYIWCLNNDTVVETDALFHLVKAAKKDCNIGICGSSSLEYEEPDKEQFNIYDYAYNMWLGTNRPYSVKEKARQYFDMYNGASFLVSKAFLLNVGLMNEEYFLYFEERDWAVRCNRSGLFKIAYAPESVIYHKGGKTTGGGKGRSYLSDFYGVRSKILFTRKYYPYCLPTVYIGLFGAMIHRIQRRQYNRIWMILKLMLNPKRKLKN